MVFARTRTIHMKLFTNLSVMMWLRSDKKHTYASLLLLQYKMDAMTNIFNSEFIYEFWGGKKAETEALNAETTTNKRFKPCSNSTFRRIMLSFVFPRLLSSHDVLMINTNYIPKICTLETTSKYVLVPHLPHNHTLSDV